MEKDFVQCNHCSIKKATAVISKDEKTTAALHEKLVPGMYHHLFILIPTAKWRGCPEEDINVFKSAFGALQNAYENSTDRDLYAVRPASAVEKEMSRMLETEKEQKQDKPKENEREEKPKVNEQEKKPPRDHDRFR